MSVIAIGIQLTWKFERMVLVVLRRAGNTGISHIVSISYIQGIQISITMRMQNTGEIKHTLKIPAFLALSNTHKDVVSNLGVNLTTTQRMQQVLYKKTDICLIRQL